MRKISISVNIYDFPLYSDISLKQILEKLKKTKTDLIDNGL